MRTSILLGVMATTLAMTAAIAPAFALTQTAVPFNISTNTQSNTQTSTQSEKAITASANVNAPTSIQHGQAGNHGLHLGLSKQDASQTSTAATLQSQGSTQNAANVNFNPQTNIVTQVAVCAGFAVC